MGIEKMKLGRFDQTIQDLRHVIGRLRESDAAPQFIVMVGSGRELIAAQNLGACWLLRKPFLPEELMGMIDHALAANCEAAGGF